ncbi:hypothetical protein [Mesorhizobium erdmanii]|uniref:hypothetical protein n=1 Tax=Mesorhizobium erdmanii TaxID=1777866 RepID=UPI0009DEA9B5|nr:hypothetical protein [Mesorhizobium erdmanii]
MPRQPTPYQFDLKLHDANTAQISPSQALPEETRLMRTKLPVRLNLDHVGARRSFMCASASAIVSGRPPVQRWWRALIDEKIPGPTNWSALQYAMRRHLVALGWFCIETVDDDLAALLQAESRERIARNCRSWQQLIEMCRRYHTDRRVYAATSNFKSTREQDLVAQIRKSCSAVRDAFRCLIDR